MYQRISPWFPPMGQPSSRLLGQARSRGVGMVRNERLPDDVDDVDGRMQTTLTEMVYLMGSNGI